jgi:hypothetical protein
MEYNVYTTLLKKIDIKTPIIIRNFLSTIEADELFCRLLDLPWHDSIKTRYGKSTRKAYMVNTTDPIFSLLYEQIQFLLLDYPIGNILGFYINLYENGDMYTPNHRHHNTNQLILSLGSTRILNIEGQSIECNNGDIIIFGDQLHGVPKTKKNTGIRISIATFCQ